MEEVHVHHAHAQPEVILLLHGQHLEPGCIHNTANSPKLLLYPDDGGQVQLHEVLLELANEHGHELTSLRGHQADTATIP